MKKIFYIILALCAAQTVFTQTPYSTGLEFNDALNAKIPVRKRATNRGGTLPAKVSLKEYCPTPQNQGEYSNCVGWAVGYAACTISEAIIQEALTDKRLNINAINTLATSPTYIYTRIKPQNDKDCHSKAAMEQVLTELKGELLPRYQDFKETCLSPDAVPKTFKTGVQIENFVNLFQPSDSKKQKLYAIKQTLANKKPVVIGVWHYKSFEKAKKIWSGNLSNYSGSGHALCVTGYDDTVEGGAIEVMNSWGTDWGESGFSKIRYKDLDTILKYAFEITLDGCQTARQTPNPSFDPPKDTLLKGSIQLKWIGDSTYMPISLRRTERSTTPTVYSYQTVKSYPSGTKYQAIFDHSEPIYLYVLSSDLTGQMEKLFPAQATMSPFLTNPKAPFTLPNEAWYIESDDRVGKDFLFFLASKTELSIDDWLLKWNEQPESASEKIRKAFSTQVFQSINALENKMSFQAKLETEKIILLVVEMGHE